MQKHRVFSCQCKCSFTSLELKCELSPRTKTLASPWPSPSRTWLCFVLQHRWRSGAGPRRKLRGQAFPHGIHDDACASGQTSPSLLQRLFREVPVPALGRGHRRRQQLWLPPAAAAQAQAGPQHQAEHVVRDGQQRGAGQEREGPRAARR